MEETTSNDRLWAALSWIPISPVWPILAIVALLMESTKDRPFVRYNAIVSIATGIVSVIITIVTFGIGGLLFLVFFYWAYKAYQGEMVTIPWVSNFVKNQGWA
ncbi:MAG: hypothetical protein JXA14_27870 [Anaerolineae bacterium]|jgi:uncharacterized membrane protein|nr:hypothetical protein [Anaerolineae bacterium]